MLAESATAKTASFVVVVVVVDIEHPEQQRQDDRA
jgi:hypothetical protein